MRPAIQRALALVLALLLCAGLLGGCSAQNRWQEQYDLGIRCLNEGKYEEALLAFEAAIQIDPNNPAAYLGAGDAHLALAAQTEDPQARREHLEKALEMYQKAQELGDETAADKVQQAQEELDKLAQEEAAANDPASALPVAAVSMQPLTEEPFDYLEEFRNGYAFAIRGLDCGYVDAQGNFTVYYQRADPVPDYVDFDTEDFFLWMLLNGNHQQMWVSEEGLFPMYDRSSELWGYGDIHTGQMVIPAAYSDACPFNEGRAVVLQYTPVVHTAPNNNNGFLVNSSAGGYPEPYISVIDTTGAVLFTAADMYDIAYTDGTLLVVGKDKSDTITPDSYLVDRNGNVLEQFAYSGAGSNYSVHGSGFSYIIDDGVVRGDPDHLCIQRTSGEVYYIDSTGNVTARVPDGAEWGFIWKEGESVAYYSKDGKYGLFNESGPVTEPLYSSAYYFAEGLAFVTEDDASWYLIDSQGNRLSQNTFDNAGQASADGLIPVKQDGLWGYCDFTGELVIPCQFYSASRFTGGVAFVTFEEEGAYAMINTKGENITGGLTILDCFTNEEGFYLVQEADGWRHVYLPG